MIDNIFQWPISKQQEGRRSEIPYSDEALRANLLRLKIAWEEFQSTRDRAAVYLYLTAVFELVAVWEKEGNAERLASRGLRLRLGDWKLAADPIAAVIFLTSDPKKVDRRTRSKWSRVLQYADEFKGSSRAATRFHPAQRRHQQMRGPVCEISRATRQKSREQETRAHLGGQHSRGTAVEGWLGPGKMNTRDVCRLFS